MFLPLFKQMSLTYVNDNRLGSYMVMIDSKRTTYSPNYPPHSSKVFPKEGKTKVPDFNSPYPSNQYSNDYPSASEYNMRTQTGYLDVVNPGLDG